MNDHLHTHAQTPRPSSSGLKQTTPSFPFQAGSTNQILVCTDTCTYIYSLCSLETLLLEKCPRLFSDTPYAVLLVSWSLMSPPKPQSCREERAANVVKTYVLIECRKAMLDLTGLRYATDGKEKAVASDIPKHDGVSQPFIFQ